MEEGKKNLRNFQLLLLVHNEKNDIVNDERKHLGEFPKFSSFVNNEKKDMVWSLHCRQWEEDFSN